MKQIDIHIPADVLRTLLEGKQTNYPYTLQGDGEPLRIVIWVAKPQTHIKYRRGRI